MNERKKDLWKKLSETYTEAVKASPRLDMGPGKKNMPSEQRKNRKRQRTLLKKARRRNR